VIHPHTIEERWFIARTYFGLNAAQFRKYELTANGFYPKFTFSVLNAWEK
jgi:hypothetical protein